ncbi:MAG: glycogen/starch synthase [Holdemania massiliensis]
MKSVLFVAAEGLPYIKTGGLADVIGSLPKILNEKGMDAQLFCRCITNC